MDCSVDQPPLPGIRSWTWGAVKLWSRLQCRLTPPLESEVELGVQWSCDLDCSADEPPPPCRIISWTWGAVKLWSGLQCRWTPPQIRSWTWGEANIICSNCSRSPPPQDHNLQSPPITCTPFPEPWNLCAPQSFRAKHALATSYL